LFDFREILYGDARFESTGKCENFQNLIIQDGGRSPY